MFKKKKEIKSETSFTRLIIQQNITRIWKTYTKNVLLLVDTLKYCNSKGCHRLQGV